MNEHDNAIDKLLLASRQELDGNLWPHWRRIITNDCRDSDGDLVVVSSWARERFDPPKYLVEQQRWAGTYAPGGNGQADPSRYTPGPLTGASSEPTDTPKFVWAREGTPGYPPQRIITAGVTGTESVFDEQICESELEARLAAWADYDKAMAPVWEKRTRPGG